MGHELALCSRRQIFNRWSGTLRNLVSVLCVTLVQQAIPNTL